VRWVVVRRCCGRATQRVVLIQRDVVGDWLSGGERPIDLVVNRPIHPPRRIVLGHGDNIRFARASERVAALIIARWAAVITPVPWSLRFIIRRRVDF